MFKKILGIALGAMSYGLLAMNCFAQEEKVTLTTYYPSPYGSYNELQLYPHSSPSTTCDNTTKGTLYYDSDDNQIYVCNGSNWVILAGYWMASPTNPNNIYNTNTGNVGIGTTNPNANLQVNGTMKVFGSWQSKSINTTYQAETDGFVVGWSDDFWRGRTIWVYTDSSSSPTTVRVKVDSDTESGDTVGLSFICPVRKGDYWKAVRSHSDMTCNLWWMPLGTSDG